MHDLATYIPLVQPHEAVAGDTVALYYITTCAHVCMLRREGLEEPAPIVNLKFVVCLVNRSCSYLKPADMALIAMPAAAGEKRGTLLSSG